MAKVVGLIGTREVLFHAPLILRLYGLRVWWRCLRSRKEATTFLQIVMESEGR